MGFSVKKTFKKLSKAIFKAAWSWATASVDAARLTLKGDVKGLVDAGLRSASYGTVGLGKKSLINPASIQKNIGGGGGGKSNLYTSAAITASTTAKAGTGKKGLLSQQRVGKQTGGGSMTEVAKNPLGGEAGKTGK